MYLFYLSVLLDVHFKSIFRLALDIFAYIHLFLYIPYLPTFYYALGMSEKYTVCGHKCSSPASIPHVVHDFFFKLYGDHFLTNFAELFAQITINNN
jgi:hypothetical protein